MKNKILASNSYALITSLWTFNFLGSIPYFLIFDFYDMPILSSWMMMKILKKWWNKTVKESMTGLYMKSLKSTFKKSFVMFIISEIFLFSSLFWMFFHSSISPTIEIGMIWPPKNLENMINPLSIPLIMSMILLMSSFTITISHHMFLNNNFYLSMKNLSKTLKMSKMFILLQMAEYALPTFKINMSLNDSLYANSFFVITFLHGMHVYGGSKFLYNSKKMFKKNSTKNFINFEMSIWYWHFVDLVWIFVYSFIYWWNKFL